MIRDDLMAERDAIASYQEVIRWLTRGASTTRRMLEEILGMEQEYADDLLSLLKVKVIGQ